MRKINLITLMALYLLLISTIAAAIIFFIPGCKKSTEMKSIQSATTPLVTANFKIVLDAWYKLGEPLTDSIGCIFYPQLPLTTVMTRDTHKEWAFSLQQKNIIYSFGFMPNGLYTTDSMQTSIYRDNILIKKSSWVCSCQIAETFFY